MENKETIYYEITIKHLNGTTIQLTTDFEEYEYLAEEYQETIENKNNEIGFSVVNCLLTNTHFYLPYSILKNSILMSKKVKL
jgi:hypothetical protein